MVVVSTILGTDLVWIAHVGVSMNGARTNMPRGWTPRISHSSGRISSRPRDISWLSMYVYEPSVSDRYPSGFRTSRRTASASTWTASDLNTGSAAHLASRSEIRRLMIRSTSARRTLISAVSSVVADLAQRAVTSEAVACAIAASQMRGGGRNLPQLNHAQTGVTVASSPPPVRLPPSTVRMPGTVTV